MFDYKKLKKYRGRKAVSPVVATLILIIVAIVGAVAVGLIVSGIGSNTSKQANVNNAASNAQNVVYVGGSTTVYPVTAAAVPAFETATGINIQLSQGGSDAGMQGILSGALDIGESSSINAVNKLIVSVSTNNILGVTVVPTLLGGSGVVAISTSKCGTYTAGTPATCAGAGALGATPLYDAATPPNACLEVSRDALAQMYLDGTFYLTATACVGNQLLNPAGVTTLVGTAGPYAASHRTDAGGTQDTYCGYLNGAPVGGAATISYTAGQEGCGNSVLQGIGNLGVLQSVQGCPSADAGCIAMVDIGFADGASAQAAATCPSAKGSLPCNVFIPEVTTGTATAGVQIAPATGEANFDPLLEASAPGAVSASSYALSTDSIGNIHTFIKTALKYGGLEIPTTLTWPTSTSVPATYFPDPTAGTAAGSQGALDRLLFVVINSQKDSPNIDKFVTFLSQPSAEQYFVGAGYDSQYDFSTA